MKYFALPIVLFCAAPLLFAQPLPRPTGFVNDFAGVMRHEDKQRLEELAAAIKQKTGVELGLATVQSIAPYGGIEGYALALFESWGPGGKGRDEGALLVFAVTEREVRIETGYGLEGTIPDSAAGRILDTAVLPDFKAGDFSTGLVKGIEALAALVAKEKGLELADFNLTPQAAPDSAPVIYQIILIVVILILIAAFSRRGRRRGFFGGGGFYGGSGGFGGGSSGGSRGGGFGGGGRSGGGGASRRF